MEPLEQRWLLSANEITFDAASSQIVISGTTGNDDVLVTTKAPDLIHVRLKNALGTLEADFQRTAVTSVAFAGDSGNDTFTNSTDLRSVVSGGAGDDILVGGSGEDVLIGDEGDDVLNGNGANDYLEGSAGNDKLRGGDGDDFLYGGDGIDQLFGQNGNDALFGDAGNDEIRGGAGNDKLRGGADDDQLFGDEDNDFLDGEAGNDSLYGGSGNDEILGGIGNDKLRGEYGDDLLAGQDGADDLNGQDGNDSLFGGSGNDLLTGGAGADKLRGEGGDDTLMGDDGNDNLDGQEGNDELFGLAGNDLLMGGAGDDKLRGGIGDDTLAGDDGMDDLDGQEGHDLLLGGIGNDLLVGNVGNDKLRGGDGDDYLYGDDGEDNLDGQNGNDWLFGYGGNDLLAGGAGNDKLRGGSGRDWLYGQGDNDDLGGDEENDFLYGGDGNDLLSGNTGADTLSGGGHDDFLYGDDGDDLIYGDDGNDNLFGFAGNDTLLGGLGDDKLRGGLGNDFLYGDDGNDNLDGQEEDDFLDGGDGNDLIVGGTGHDTLRGGAGFDQLSGNEGNDDLDGQLDDDQLFGLEGDDLLVGGSGHDWLSGGNGNDRLFGGEGNDRLDGFYGDDLLDGGLGNDVLNGEVGHDRLLGGEGDDQLYGNEGNDLLAGGDGSDTLYSASGNDVLIGGASLDSLDGSFGDDLLLGGSTVYDSDPDALLALLQLWSSGDSYDERIAAIESEFTSVRLKSGETVLDDQIADLVYGGDGLDWFFLTGSVPIYSPVMTDPDSGVGTENTHHSPEIVHTLPPLEGFDLIVSLDKFADVQTNEKIHSKLPHATNGVLQREHLSLFELIRYDQITHFAIADGNWSDPATWLDGVVPTDGSRVLIAHGAHVVVDSVIPTRLATVRVDGSLSFATQVDSELRVDTLVVTTSGAFEMGTELDPIASAVTARLLITDSGPIDRAWDPFGISRGLLTHGRTAIYGASVLTKSTLEDPATAGSKWLKLVDSPTTWKVGDEIVIAGTVAGGHQDELRTILAISGDFVKVAPLTYDHVSPATEMPIHVAHLTRNAIIESESSAIDRRGHVMFMHTRNAEVQYAGFYKLGRTNKLQVINDPVVDSNWALQPGTGTNPRARYPVHFHRNGLVDDGNPVLVNGSVVADAPGWGFVNHSSYVDFTDNVAYNVTGAAFSTEVGDEIGSFRNNLAIHSNGSGELIDSRNEKQDFGHQGDGFWFQGAGISVTDNVSIGNSGSAFVFYTRGLIEGGVTKTFLSQNLANPSIAGGAATIKVDFVPVKEFDGNLGLASDVGLRIRYHLRDAPHEQQSVFQNSTFWNNRLGIDLPYTHQTILKNLTVIDTTGSEPPVGLADNAVTRDIVYENLKVVGYVWGIDVARGGNSVVSGGYFDNRHNIVIRTPSSSGRTVLVTGPISFVVWPVERRHANEQTDVLLASDFVPEYLSVNPVFFSNTVILDYGPFANRQAYFNVQFPSAIPFPVAGANVPLEYVGLTSQELHDYYGLTVGGELAPVNAVTVPRIGGLLAPP